jgi:transcriptional regulator with XRE-family HTH domain
MSDAELLGNELRDARLRQGLTLAQVERQTRIRIKYLEALEQGNYSLLPSGVHARGFLRSYARLLGLDGDLAVARFEDIMAGGRRRGRRSAPIPALVDETPRLKKRATQDTRGTPPLTPLAANSAPAAANRGRLLSRALLGLALVMILITVAGLALILFGDTWRGLLNSLFNPTSISAGVATQGAPDGFLDPLRTGAASPTALTEMAETQEATMSFSAPTSAPLPSPLPNPNATPTPEPTLPLPPPGVGDNVLVELRITARTWLQVIRDGQVEYTGVLAPGTSLRSTGKRIQVRVSNAIGVEVLVNGVSQGILGPRGAIVEKIYQPGGILLPTPLPTDPDVIPGNAQPTPPTPGTGASA